MLQKIASVNTSEDASNLTVFTSTKTYEQILEGLSGDSTGKNAKKATALYGLLSLRPRNRIEEKSVNVFTVAIVASAVIQAFDQVTECITEQRHPDFNGSNESEIFNQLIERIPKVLTDLKLPDAVVNAVCDPDNMEFYRDMYNAMLREKQCLESGSLRKYYDVSTSSNGLHLVARMLYSFTGREVPPIKDFYL